MITNAKNRRTMKIESILQKTKDRLKRIGNAILDILCIF